ncbi:MAG: SPW repeat protein [Phycisphaeraceae bacterium]|nr:SPW repeat protein [Phycisphaeraceae bacterium]
MATLTAREEQRLSQIFTASGINLLTGIWLIIAPFVLAFGFGVPIWNSVVVGGLIIILASVRLVAVTGQMFSWVNALLGVWLVMSPFALSFNDLPRALWNSIVCGVIVIVFGMWSASVSRPAHYPPEV